MAYTEDTLVQQATVKYLEDPLVWESVCFSHNALALSCLVDGAITV